MCACQAASGSVQVIATRPNVCKQLHMPAQSGSTSTLQRMRRGYTREAYDALVQHVRDIVPNVALSSDIITGRSRHHPGNQAGRKPLRMCQRCTWCLLSASELTTAYAVGICVQQPPELDPCGLWQDTVVPRQELSCAMRRPHSMTQSTLFTSRHARAAWTALSGMWQQPAKDYAVCCSCWAPLACMPRPACASVQVESDTATLSLLADRGFEQASLFLVQGSQGDRRRA